MAALTADEMTGLVRFVNKATGWLYVALGALLIAVKETWELVEFNEWPSWLFWALIVLMAAAATLNTTVRMVHTHRLVDQGSGRR